MEEQSAAGATPGALEGDLPPDMGSTSSETDFCRIFLKDKISGLLFLVDTESYLCMFPKKNSQHKQLKREFWAKIKPGSFDTVLLELDFSLDKKFRWSFVTTDVEHPVIGVDFLNYYNLHVDFKNKIITDQTTFLTTKCETLKERTVPSMPSEYERLLKDFPRLNKPFEKGAIKHDVVHHIHTTPGPPVTTKLNKLPSDMFEVALEVFSEMIDSGQAVLSSSPWSSPLVCVPKQEGGLQLGGDYRALNARTVVDRYPLPHIEDFTKSLHGKKVYSNINLFRTYDQIPVAKSDICKTAVLTPFGLFEFPKMSFGLRNNAQTYQRFIDQILNGLDFAFGYLNTILVASASEDEHLRHLKILFSRLDNFGVTLDLPKCVFGVAEITFLGYSFSEEGTSPSREKVETVINFPKPNTVQQMREFLGVVNFYRRFIPKAGEILKPLNELQLAPKKGTDIIPWTRPAEEAFENIKKALNNAKAIPHPISNAELSIMCYTSDRSVNATLQQMVDGSWQPLSFFTKSLTFSQRNYNAYDRALYCIYAAIRRFRYILESRRFIIFTDHKPVTSAFSRQSNKHSSRQFSFLDFIGQFSTDIRHMEKSEAAASKEAMVTPQVSMAQPADDRFQSLPGSGNYSDIAQSSWCVSTATGSFPISPNASPVENLPLRLPEGQTLAIKHPEPTSHKSESQCAVSHGPTTQRQIKAPPMYFPTGKFEHVHLDLIGPLPPLRGFSYCLTCIDRSSRWPEVVPLENLEDETIARAFISGWVSRFGVPGRITTNRGNSFDSLLFQELFKTLGISHSQIISGGTDDAMEQYQRQLESAIKYLENGNWLDSLPVVLLGMRTAIKKDIGKPPTELLYGSTLRLPEEFFQTTDLDECMTEFVDNLRKLFREIQVHPVRNRNIGKPFICRELRSSSHVFVKVGGLRRLFHPVYDGPYKLIEYNNMKSCIVEKYGRKDALSAKLLKPAHFYNDDDGEPF